MTAPQDKTQVCVIRTTRGGKDPDFYIHVVPLETHRALQPVAHDPWIECGLIEDTALVSYLDSEAELENWLSLNNAVEAESLDAVGY